MPVPRSASSSGLSSLTTTGSISTALVEAALDRLNQDRSVQRGRESKREERMDAEPADRAAVGAERAAETTTEGGHAAISQDRHALPDGRRARAPPQQGSPAPAWGPSPRRPGRPLGPAEHNRWMPKLTRQMVCDQCSKREPTGVMQKCALCPRMVCRDCIYSFPSTDKHFPLDDSLLDWYVTKTSRRSFLLFSFLPPLLSLVRTRSGVEDRRVR
jgi:hypothetical protein